MQLPADADEDAIAAAARARDVGVYPLSACRLAHPGGQRGLVLGFGNLDVGPIGRGIARVADLIA